VSDLFDSPLDLSVPNSSPTPEDLAAVIFNEHRSAHGAGIDDSVDAMAHVLLNRMSAGIPFGKGTARATLPDDMSGYERQFLKKAQSAVHQAVAERARGIDSTHGALYWRHQAVDPRWSPEFAKDWFATETFQNTPLAHSFGPFENSAPSSVLPKGHPIYLNIYGDQPWGDESPNE
jgi:UDP:flavonoid glycosyltransferase YjiC (YdhE family)